MCFQTCFSVFISVVTVSSGCEVLPPQARAEAFVAAADMTVKMGQPAAAVTEYDTMCFWVEDGSVRLAMLPFTTVAIFPSLTCFVLSDRPTTCY